ncbi:MAG TPA: hypothetical protein VHC22_25930 [Pirellulales bacterium]|nr:hypothetical protein [Pirellulales bacterium]
MRTSAENTDDRSSFPTLTTVLALAAVLAAGIVLRLVWLDDIEYKGDEAWTWHHAKAAGVTEPLSWVGMPTSAGPENPGMSLWAFLPLAWVSDDPVDMARCVACLSVVGIGVLVWFAYRWAPADEREVWLWAAALWAVNPLSVLYHRKIWPNCLFPLLVSLLLLCWYRRDRRVGAFVWGVLGASLTQINLSAGFFAAGFVLWSWLADRSRVAWKSWFAGSLLAAWPLVPWCHYILTKSTQPRLTTIKLTRLLEFKFVLRWLNEPFGFGLDHSLGDDSLDFSRQPVIAGTPTWLVALLQVTAVALALGIGWGLILRLRRERPDWRAVLFPVQTFSGLVCTAGFWGYGLLLTLSCLPQHTHYMIICYPIALLSVVHVAFYLTQNDREATRRARKLLAGLVVVELLLSTSFLSYVHVKQDIRGDYGMTLRAQRLSASRQHDALNTRR